MIYAGVDAGSRAIKIVLLNEEGSRVEAAGISDQGVDQNALAAGLYEDLLKDRGIEPGRVSRVVATGYGRNLVRFADARITEITCHAHGVLHHLPGTGAPEVQRFPGRQTRAMDQEIPAGDARPVGGGP